MERKNVGEVITEANRDARNRHHVRTQSENSDTMRHQTPRHTGSDCVKIRHYRAAVVCLVLLCGVLLAGVIVLGVDLHNMIEDFYTKNKNLTEEIDELKTDKYKLENNITKLSNEKQTLLKKNKDVQEMMTNLSKQISQMDGWNCYQNSLYYVSTAQKNWIESKRDCTERGADLIILNDKQEQEFLKNNFGQSDSFWIGLTKVGGTWKWVDGSILTAGFWGTGKLTNEDCAIINTSTGVVDYSCRNTSKWICERNN